MGVKYAECVSLLFLTVTWIRRSHSYPRRKGPGNSVAQLLECFLKAVMWKENSKKAILHRIVWCQLHGHWSSQVALVVKKPPANAGDISNASLIPGLGRSPGEGHSNLLQYSCLDRGAWWAAVHRVTQSRTWLKWLSTHTHMATTLGIYNFLGSRHENFNRWMFCISHTFS